MDGLIKDILSNLGLPTIGISVLLLIFKLSPITSLSSSSIEMILSTKEKRVYVSVFRFILEIISNVLILIGITNSYFTSKNIYNPIVAIIIGVFVIVVSFWVLERNWKNKTIFDIQNRIWRCILGFFVFLLSFICIFILPAYYFGTQLYPEVHTKEDQLYVFKFLSITYFFYFTLMYRVIRMYYKFLDFSGNRNINLQVTIQSESWFILYPIEKELFLLGDKCKISECSQIKFLKKWSYLKTK